MEQALLIRETLISFFKRYEAVILFMVKFVVGLVLFSVIGGIGQSMPVFDKVTSSSMALPYTMLLSLIFAVAPMPLNYALVIINIGIQTSAVLEVSIAIVIFLTLLLLLYARMAPKESALILAMVAAYYFKLPYLIPIVAGMYCSLMSIIPISIGVFIWHHIPLAQSLLKSGAAAGHGLSDLPAAYQDMYIQVMSVLSANQSWIIISFICAMVVLVVYVVSRLSMDFSKDIAIGLGGVMTLISFAIAVLVADVKISLVGVLLSAIFSCTIAELIRFFDVVLDYERAERVQFQDEDNVYYVRIVPKVILSKRRPVVRTINGESAADYRAFEERHRTPEDRHRNPEDRHRTGAMEERYRPPSHDERRRPEPQDDRYRPKSKP